MTWIQEDRNRQTRQKEIHGLLRKYHVTLQEYSEAYRILCNVQQDFSSRILVCSRKKKVFFVLLAYKRNSNLPIFKISKFWVENLYQFRVMILCVIFILLF